jgi:hypothetical protein
MTKASRIIRTIEAGIASVAVAAAMMCQLGSK